MNRRSSIFNRSRSATTNIIPDNPRELETFREQRIRNLPDPTLGSNILFDYSFPSTPFLTYGLSTETDSLTNPNFVSTPLGRIRLNATNETPVTHATRRRALFRNLHETLDQAEAEGTPSDRLEHILELGFNRLIEALAYESTIQ